MQLGRRQRIARFRQEENGQTLVFAAVCIAVLIAFLGLAIDVGHVRLAKRQLQMAADAAAMAGGLELRVCGASIPCTAMTSAVQSSLTENGYSSSTVVYNCATLPTGPLIASVNTPPCALGTSDPNSGKAGYLEVRLQRQVSPYFARVLGFSTFTVAARSEVRHAGGPCIYALDPSGANAISVAASLTSTCGIVDESNNASAFSCAAGAVSAPQINIAGGTAKLLCSMSPKARTGAPIPTPADPLKNLPTPSIPACGTTSAGLAIHGAPAGLTSYSPPSGAVLYSDKAYCSGISIGAATKVTFAGGTYVLKSASALAGGLNISLLANVTGTGVTFYNYGPYGGLSMMGTGLSQTTLIAPTSGTYSGILYLQDSGNTTAANLAASSTATNLQGGFYLPSATLNFLLATPSPYTVLVAKDINFTAALTLNGNFSSLLTGSPLNADNVQLVE